MLKEISSYLNISQTKITTPCNKGMHNSFYSLIQQLIFEVQGWKIQVKVNGVSE
jgi:hypothetical protein